MPILVSKVRIAPIVLKKSDFVSAGGWRGRLGGGLAGSDVHRLGPHREQFGQLAEVLGGGGEEELIIGAVGTSET